jgi:hypothetical protein
MNKAISVVSACLLAGSATVAVAQAQSDGLKVDQLEQRSWPAISLGRDVSGNLTTADVKRDDNTYTDGFLYNAKAGETVTITQRSPDFDSWLILDDPNGDTYKYNDDGGGGRDARLVFTFPHAGRYLILANNVSPGTTGRYTLSVVRGSLPIAAATTPSAPASSGNTGGDWAALSQRLFDVAATKFGENGYSPTAFVRTGQLANNGSDRIPVHLSGQQTHILGACDNDCKNMDMQLLDSGGNVISEDVETDDFPIVSSTSKYVGDYTIVVKMVNCGAAPCHYSVKMFAK